MHYEDYLKLRQDLRKKITKLEEHYKVVDECYEKTQMRSVAVEREHIQEVINCLEEAYNSLAYFVELE